MTNHPIIQLNDISAAYDGKTVLSRVNLNVYEHDFLGVIGPNGGGKTTLIKLILGLLKPVSGTIRFYKNGKEVPEITMDTCLSTTALIRSFLSRYTKLYCPDSANRNHCCTAIPRNSMNRSGESFPAWDWRDWKDVLSVS